jgi:hypothetical protein
MSSRPASQRKPGRGPALESSEAISARLDEIERKIERLRALYESFFLGVERRPPEMPRQELNRLMLELQQVPIRNAALRFRFQSFSQRWTLLVTYWNRTLREIESGTYRRDLQKAYRRIAARGDPLTEVEAASLGIPAGRAKAFVAQQNRRWGSAQAASAAPSSTAPNQEKPLTPAAPAPAMSTEDADLRVLHQAYIEAHARLGLPGAPPTEERMRAKVLPQLERLRAANPDARLSLTVATENGRVVVRAKPSR